MHIDTIFHGKSILGIGFDKVMRLNGKKYRFSWNMDNFCQKKCENRSQCAIKNIQKGKNKKQSILIQKVVYFL